MAWFDFGSKRNKRNSGTGEGTGAADLGTSTGAAAAFARWGASRSRPMLLSAVYRCVDLLSDALAVLPLEPYRIDSAGFKTLLRDSTLYDVLTLEPNENMSRFVFFKTLMASVLLTGNGYAYIARNAGGEIDELVFLPSDCVSVEWVPDRLGVQRKRYRVTGVQYFNHSGLIEPRDIIHVLNFSYDGIVGVSTLTHARESLAIAGNSEKHAGGFFEGGASLAGTLTFERALKKEQKEQIYQAWEERTNPVTGKPNGIVVLEGGQKYTPISISPRDSQLLESRQFNVIDICRFFSVSPVKVFDLSKSSYSTIEASQLGFLTDTLLPQVAKFEDEINRKIFLREQRKDHRAEFNTSVLLRADKSALSQYWNTMFQIGAATPNEVRRANNLAKVEGGDCTFVQVNVQPLDRAVAGPTSTEQGIDENDANT